MIDVIKFLLGLTIIVLLIGLMIVVVALIKEFIKELL